MYPRSISSRTRLALSVLPSVSGWSDVDIFNRVLIVLNTDRQNSAVDAVPDRTRAHESAHEAEDRVDKDTRTT